MQRRSVVDGTSGRISHAALSHIQAGVARIGASGADGGRGSHRHQFDPIRDNHPVTGASIGSANAADRSSRIKIKAKVSTRYQLKKARIEFVHSEPIIS
jgi:hypothetical protein